MATSPAHPPVRVRLTVSTSSVTDELYERITRAKRHDVEILRLAELGHKAEASLILMPTLLGQILDSLKSGVVNPSANALSSELLGLAKGQTTGSPATSDSNASAQSQVNVDMFSDGMGIDVSYFDGPDNLTP